MRSLPAETEPSTEPTRVCAECRRSKTIRGVWYLLPGHGLSPFVCETCFGRVRSALKGAA